MHQRSRTKERMSRLTKIRLTLTCMAFTVLVACSTASPENAAKVEPDLEAWRGKIAKILQSGWEVNLANKSLVITRKEPVTYYNPIALPAFGDLRKEMIERSKTKEPYQITLDVSEKLSTAKYEELKAINRETNKELDAQENRMRNFASKGTYDPVTPADQLLYKQYQNALSTLPYHRLPDLYDDKHSLYVTTSRDAWAAFYSAREEQECRAVIENIYSYAEAYEGEHLVGWPPDTKYDRVAASECFNTARVYDLYLKKKELNLR
jgi:hypothetical protein